MDYFTDLEEVLGYKVWLTIGNFDGFHLGHQAISQRFWSMHTQMMH